MIPKLLFVALEFYREPRRFNNLRDPNGELPPGVTEFLSAPTNCLNDESVDETANAMVASAQELHECVLFFIKQVLFTSGGNYYRVLGVSRDAPAAQIKEHYFYLMRLFHPDKDVNNEGWDDLYAPRINEAYNVLRNAGKRADYDASLAPLDGFNPSEIGAVAMDSAAAPAGSTAPQPAGSAGVSQPVSNSSSNAANNAPNNGANKSAARPWILLVSALIVIGVLGLLGNFLVSSQSSNELTVTAAPSTAKSTAAKEDQLPRQYNSIEDVDALRNGTQESSYSTAEQADAEPTEGDPQTHHAATDAEIEAMIARRVNRATVAVLGSPSRRAKSASKPQQAQVQKSQDAPPEVDTTAVIEQSKQVVEVAPAENAAQPVDASQVVVAAAAQEEVHVVDVAADVPAVGGSPEAQGTAAQASVAVQPAHAADEAAVTEVAVASDQVVDIPADEEGERELVANADAVIAAANVSNTELPKAANAIPPQQEEVAAAIADDVAHKPQLISNDQVATVLNSFKTAYETGDAGLFASLFTDDAITTDADGRRDIRKLYAEFFEATVIKQVQFAEQDWDATNGNSRFGSALVTIISEPAGGGEEYVARITIAFELTLGLNSTPLIARMIY